MSVEPVGEEVLGIIDGVKWKRRNWSLLVTPERIVVATVGRSGLGAAFELGGIVLAKARVRKRTDELRKLSAEAALASHGRNFDIRISSIERAEMEDPAVVATGVLQIQTASDQYEFLLTDEESYGNGAGFLQSILKEKLQFH